MTQPGVFKTIWEKANSMIRSTRLLGSVALVASFATLVAACGDGEATIYGLGGDAGVPNTPCVTGQTRDYVCRNDCRRGEVPQQTCMNNTWENSPCSCSGTAVESCVPNSNRASATCNSTVCPAGQAPALVCNSTGLGESCGCVTSNTVVRCTVGATESCPSSLCPSGQSSSRTCGGDGTWGACSSCTGTTTVTCAAGDRRACTGTIPSGCTGSGQYTQEVCGASGWGACTCFGTSTGTTCTAGFLGAPTSCPSSFTCPAGTVIRQQCNASGTGFTGDCECQSDGSPTTVCSAGSMVRVNCGAVCNDAGSYAAMLCNPGGTGYVAGSCRCTGSTVINRNGRLAIDSRWQYVNLVSGAQFCRPERLHIRIFDGRGNQITSSAPMTDRTYAIATTDTGTTMFEVTCGNGASDPVHPAFTTRFVEGRRFSEYGVTVASVTGGDSEQLVNQVNVGMFCRVSNPDGGRTQGALAVNSALLGRCPNF